MLIKSNFNQLLTNLLIMKKFLCFYFVFSLVVVLFSCSSDDSDSDDVGNFEITHFEIAPNFQNSLVSKVFVENDQATSYFYGNSDMNGELVSLSGIAYQEINSNQITYFTLDAQGRLSHMYTETNGVKDPQIITFNYPSENLVNCIFLERNWDTGINSLLQFVPVEIDGENFTAIPLLNRQVNDSAIYQFLASHIGTVAGVMAVVAVSAVGVAVGGVALGVIGGLTLSTALLADENNGSDTSFVPVGSEEPEAPEEEVANNQCESSGLEVIIGVDPGNVLVAIVNGDSVDYDFYWSTGESDTSLASDSITVSEDGTYYVIVVDDNACFAFASATISENTEIDPSLIIGTWLLTGKTGNGVDVFDPNECDLIAIFDEINYTNTAYYDANPGSNDCSLEDTTVNAYEIDGNILYETDEGDTTSALILELNETTLVIQEEDGSYISVETFTRQ